MTNHTHLLVTPGTERSIPNLMQAIGREYVQAINRQYNRTGTLWQGRYKASLVQNDHYLLNCCRYIELNPVRAGMVRDPDQYPYSSYRRNAIGESDELVATHDVYEELGKTEAQRCAAYRALFANEFPADLLKEIRDTTNACQILGNDKFKDQIEAMLGRSVRPGRAGRPIKRTV